MNGYTLFRRYPRLQKKLPFVSLGTYPTPIQKLNRLGRALNMDSLFLKDDGLSSETYGGNKVRKLEFLLGQASKEKVKEVLSFGYAGSNFTLASTIFSKQLGLKCVSMLLPQPNATYVRKNLLVTFYWGGELHCCPNIPFLIGYSSCLCLYYRIMHGVFPLILPAGGTSPLGVVGYVNAAFELKEQISAGKIPEPDLIYVALGTMGTAVGLMIGLHAAGLKTRVAAIRIVNSRLVSDGTAKRLLKKSNEFIQSLDASFPNVLSAKHNMKIRDEFLGPGYANFTVMGMEAVRQMKDLEDTELDGTYTGKALAALIDDAKNGFFSEKTVLFWNTLNARDSRVPITGFAYRKLPRPFHRYFEEDVQLLDRSSLRFANPSNSEE